MAPRPSPGDEAGLATAQALLGKKWVLQILVGATRGLSRFNEFAAENPGLSDRVLAARLGDLVRAGLLRKDGAGKQVRYSLTDFGQDAKPLLLACAQFGLRAASNARAVGVRPAFAG